MHNTFELLTIVIKDGYCTFIELILDINIALVCLEKKCECLLVLFDHIVIDNCDIELQTSVPWFKR